MSEIDFIRYNGKSEDLIWRYPNNELNTWAHLIVGDSQEAVFFNNGKCYDSFLTGDHTLSIGDIPQLTEALNIPFGGLSRFRADIWYINKSNDFEVKWGTPSQIEIRDSKYNVYVPIRSFGTFKIQIVNSKKFLEAFVGVKSTLDTHELQKQLKGDFLPLVSDVISSYISEQNISILEVRMASINSYLENMTLDPKKPGVDVFEQYGVKIVNITVLDISTPEDDATVKKLKGALLKRAEKDIIGTNPNIKYPNTDFLIIRQKVCTNCRSAIPEDARFCRSCGYDTMSSTEKEPKTIICCSSCGLELDKDIKFCPNCGDKYHPCPDCGNDIKLGVNTCSCGYAKPKTCISCGKDMPAEYKFCPECGASQTKTCSNCNSTLSENVKFCPNCGTSTL